MKLECTIDEVGYWTPGKVYETKPGGRLTLTTIACVGDDDEPASSWALNEVPNPDSDDVPLYEIMGLMGLVQFKQVDDQ